MISSGASHRSIVELIKKPAVRLPRVTLPEELRIHSSPGRNPSPITTMIHPPSVDPESVPNACTAGSVLNIMIGRASLRSIRFSTLGAIFSTISKNPAAKNVEDGP